MNKQQWVVAGGGIVLLFSLYFFGRTTPNPKGTAATAATSAPAQQAHDDVTIDDILSQARQRLSPEQAARVTALENSLSRGDLVTQKIAVYGQLSSFWRDSARVMEPYLWYLGEKAKL